MSEREIPVQVRELFTDRELAEYVNDPMEGFCGRACARLLAARAQDAERIKDLVDIAVEEGEKRCQAEERLAALERENAALRDEETLARALYEAHVAELLDGGEIVPDEADPWDEVADRGHEEDCTKESWRVQARYVLRALAPPPSDAKEA